jgi:hypothetical protein
VVLGGAIVEIVDPGVTIDRRNAQLDTWVAPRGGAIVVLLSDPGRSTGFSCC